MNRVVTENIGNARDITLLGGRLQLENGYLTLGENDLLRDGTSYYSFSSLSDSSEFLESIRKQYVWKGQPHVFDGATIKYKLEYVPVLKCGNRLLTLNSEDDYFITDNFFDKPYYWDKEWDNMITPVAPRSIQCSSGCSVLPIKLSYKEISYLAPRLNLPLQGNLQVVLLPFHVASITNNKHEYHVAQIALKHYHPVCDYPMFEDSTFSAINQVFMLIALYCACVAFIILNKDQAEPFTLSYLNWIKDHFYISGLVDTWEGYIPILGSLIGFLLEVVLVIVLVFVFAGVVPSIAMIVPLLVSVILSFCTLWLRRLYLLLKKMWLFKKAVPLPL